MFRIDLLRMTFVSPDLQQFTKLRKPIVVVVILDSVSIRVMTEGDKQSALILISVTSLFLFVILWKTIMHINLSRSIGVSQSDVKMHAPVDFRSRFLEFYSLQGLLL